MIALIELYSKTTPEISIHVSYNLNQWEIYDPENSDKGKILAFLALYSDGQIVDGDNEFEPLPDGCYYIQDREDVDETIHPKFKEIKAEHHQIEITHLPSPFSIYDSTLYKTQIINKGPAAFKIIRFTAYWKSIWHKFKSRPSGYAMIDGFFNGDDFKMWYGQKSEWITPGSTVCDFRNYGEDCVWLYEVEIKNGEKFWIGSLKTTDKKSEQNI